MKHLKTAVIPVIAACLLASAAPPAWPSAPVPTSISPAAPPPDRPVKRARKPVCKVDGKLNCSEYGYRYQEPLLVVFQDPEDRYTCPVSEKDGGFSVDLPAGTFTIRVEFQGKGFDTGSLTVPLDCVSCAKDVQLYQSGSMLELVWQIRDSGGGSLGIKITDVPPPIK